MSRLFSLDHFSHILGYDQKFSRKPELIYKYQLTGSNIRLLRLLPGSLVDKIKCELVDASLEDPPDFEAISYVWGPPREREAVTCQGHRAYITNNLAHALRRLRNTQKSSLLWADGICINQHDVSEKGHQVQMMGEIYQKASRVIIWLGPDTEYGQIKKAMEVIRYVHSKIPNPQHGTKAVLKPGDPTIETLDEHMRARRIEGTWEALDDLFKREWWLRIWCVQEAVLARKTIIYCSYEELDCHLVGAFTRWHHSQRWLGQAKPNGFDETGLKSAYRRLNTWSWSGSFIEIVDTFRGLQATDSRDKIYALLGLLHHSLGEQVQITVDYHKSVPEVLFDATRQSIRSEGNLHFLSYIDYRPNLEDRGSLPSWLPRWNETREPWQDHLWCDSSVLSASCDKSLRDFPLLYVEKLPLHGVHFGTVHNVTDVLWPTAKELDLVLKKSLKTQISCIVNLLLTSHGIFSSSPHDGFSHLRDVDVDVTKEDLSLCAGALIKVATTLTGGFIKTDGWVENRAYLERIDSDAGLQYLADFFALLEEQHMMQYLNQELKEALQISHLTGRVPAYIELVKTYCAGRRLFETNRYFGLGPRDLKKGDVVAVLDGGKVPYILRPFAKENEHAFLGECFVYDIMNGEAYEMCGEGEVEEKMFVLR